MQYGSVSEIHVMHVSGMIQGCVRDVSGTSYGIEYVIIGIYMQYGSAEACYVPNSGNPIMGTCVPVCGV